MATAGKFPCQTVVLRYSPDAVSGEVLNVGVVVACSGLGFLKTRSLNHWGRITAAFPSTEVAVLRRALAAVSAACDGQTVEPGFESQGTQVLTNFLHSAAASEEMGLKFSQPLPGVTDDAEATLNDLFERFVERERQPSEV